MLDPGALALAGSDANLAIDTVMPASLPSQYFSSFVRE